MKYRKIANGRPWHALVTGKQMKGYCVRKTLTFQRNYNDNEDDINKQKFDKKIPTRL